MQDLNLVIIVLTDVLPPNSITPSVATRLITQKNMYISFKASSNINEK